MTTDALLFSRNGCDFSVQLARQLGILGFSLTHVETGGRDGAKIPEEIHRWKGQYIFAFRSLAILPKQLLERAEVAAINFHPGPPEYPGSGCLNWALYEGANVYGCTAHIMNALVDNGPIVEARRFAIHRRDTVSTLLLRTHRKTFDLAVDVTTGIAREGTDFLKRKLDESKFETWRGAARRIRELDDLERIDPAITREELERRIRATAVAGHGPFVQLHGYRFVLDSSFRES